MKRLLILAAAGAATLLGGCARDKFEFDQTGGVRVTRSACPGVGIPAYTGDVTLFDPPASREARAIDVVATVTNLKVSCAGETDPLQATITFDVLARRTRPGPAREVVLPYFAAVVRGGTEVVSKQIGRVSISFPEGQLRAQTSGQASASVSRAAATIPANIEQQINRKRKPGDEDAAIDPLADPAVRAAVSRASFELLVGFQLTDEQLRYNATR